MKKKKFQNNNYSSVQKSLDKQFPDDTGSDSDHEAEQITVNESMLQTIPSCGKSKKKSSGFQSFGLSFPVLKGILKKGYKVPTPIQRKAIPMILEGKDVVAMARTGSGKTGAFLIPMLEKLKTKNSAVGARALIFSPTRELALQTLKFAKEIGRYTGLKAVLVLGGQKIEEQFAAIHENPDIIIATPGRFLHLVIEMDLKLNSVEYIVFDEADRLFEMGFREQLLEVLNRLPLNRQTLMFSATLPCVLVDFVKAGLTDPVLIRLDVESNLSENLKTSFICCRPDDKPAILLHLLKNILNLAEELTVVFLATRHHIEYLKAVLDRASISSAYVYSSMDQTARKISVEKFRSKQVSVLLVTDIAARGIDIPLLDNVVNYNFPGKPKLFVHRVGRVARAGRSGSAFSFIAPDEGPYLLDLHLFLGKSIVTASSSDNLDGICGTCPQTLIDDQMDLLKCYHNASIDLKNMAKCCSNGYKQYLKSRPLASSESNRRIKDFNLFNSTQHPIFCSADVAEIQRSQFLANMKNYRPNSTIFEIGATAKSQASVIMRQKKEFHSLVQKNRNLAKSSQKTEEKPPVGNEISAVQPLASENEIQSTFNAVTVTDDNQKQNKTERKKQKNFRDAEHYVTYTSSRHYTEKGLGMENSFEQNAANAVLDLTADDSENLMKQKNSLRWDRKRKRFVRNDDNEQNKKKMKTESGVWIPKSYKSDLYKKWQESSKVCHRQGDSDEETNSNFKPNRKNFPKQKGTDKTPRKGKKPPKREMKTKEEILKTRKKAAKMRFKQKSRQDRRAISKSAKR